jgi:hypothetical protein
LFSIGALCYITVICKKKKLALVNLTFEQCKWIIKCYWKMENVTKVQRHWRNKFGTPPPTRDMVTKICDKSEADGTV